MEATHLTERMSKGPASVEALPTFEEGGHSATRSRHGKVQLAMQSLIQHLREGRNLGPLAVLLMVLIYSLLSPHLPTPIHDYIYQIAH